MRLGWAKASLYLGDTWIEHIRPACWLSFLTRRPPCMPKCFGLRAALKEVPPIQKQHSTGKVNTISVHSISL